MEAFERAGVGVRLGTTAGPTVGAYRLAWTTPAIRDPGPFGPSRRHWHLPTDQGIPREIPSARAAVTDYTVGGLCAVDFDVATDWWTHRAPGVALFSGLAAS